MTGVLTATSPITDRVTLFQTDHFSRNITTTLQYAKPSTSVTAYDPLTMRMQGQYQLPSQWTSQQYDLLGRVTTTIQNCRDGGGDPV